MIVTDKLRSDAAELCAIAASWGGSISVFSVVAAAPWLQPAANLARLSWLEAWRESDHVTMDAQYAEAEALLRCGWTPEGWE
jgi:hypothetical protein